MIYIKYKHPDATEETIDQVDTLIEARKLIKEYRLSDKIGNYWIDRHELY